METSLQSSDLLRGVLAADREDQGLLSSPNAVSLLARIDEIAQAEHCTALLAASPSGHRLVGAMLFHFSSSYRVWQPGDAEPVLVLEGVALGDAALAVAMKFAKAAGALKSLGLFITSSEFPPATPTIDSVMRLSADDFRRVGHSAPIY